MSDGSLPDSEAITLTVLSSAEAAYDYLSQVMDRYQAGDVSRLLESYTATPTFTFQQNVAHLYDSALALLAFLERGTPEDLTRARAIAEAFFSLQQHDPELHDGRLRDAYAADSLLDGSGVARLQLASSHTGNLAWVILALGRYHQAQGGEKFLEAAVRLGEWIAQNTLDTTVTDGKGKYRFSLYNTGTYTVEPSWEGSRFAPESVEVTLTNGNRGGVNFKEVP